MSFRSSQSGRRVARRDGFTLIALLVVIAIIAAVAWVVGPSILGNVGHARASAARSQLQIFALALDSYRLDNNAYPTSAQGLEALRTLPTTGDATASWRGPYLRQAVPADPWGRPYAYVSPGVANPTGYDLYTLGRDGRPGGSGEDADVTSWNGVVEL